MSCPRLEHEVAAYLDGELDLASAVAFERHLPGCPECARALAAEEALRAAIGRADLRHLPSPEQRLRFLKAARTSAAAAPASFPLIPTARLRPLASLAALLLVALASWSLGRFTAPRPAPDLDREVVAGHVRSLLAGHPTDVPSTDRHTVKPWFTGKLDYAPTVVDLAPQGFPLVGGRLDYLEGRPVAALVYRSDRHLINLFTWPAGATREPVPQASTRQGFHLLHWTAGGMAYWAVSDVEPDRLARFAGLVSHLASGVPP
jgi:anti-sigma factor RsiW